MKSGAQKGGGVSEASGIMIRSYLLSFCIPALSVNQDAVIDSLSMLHSCLQARTILMFYG